MIIRTFYVADAVLDSVAEFLLLEAPDLYLEPYQNGREHGWALSAGENKVAFAQDRHSDRIVVYAGRLALFDPVGNVPDGKAYDQRRHFPGDQPDAAAAYILSALIPA